MPVSRRVARFNRVFANYIVGPILTRLPGFGTIHHRGRRSGRVYRTPVRVFRHGGDYLVTLPYGPKADWVRNVMAAGGCELEVRGRLIRLGQPKLVTDDGTAPIPRVVRRILSRLDAKQYLVLTPVGVTPSRWGTHQR